jgi:hypothetical protein
MNKQAKKSETESIEFKNFENFTKNLLNVSKKEIDQRLERERENKKKQKKKR